MNKSSIKNNYFSKIIKHHKNNHRVFSSLDNFTYSLNCRYKILLISRIINYYGQKNQLLTKLIDDFFELHSIFDDFDDLNILIDQIFYNEMFQFNRLENPLIEEEILKYKPIFLTFAVPPLTITLFL